MAICPDCNEGILDNATSNIPTPLCQDCTQEVNCEGITTSSTCVTVPVALPCIDSSAGDTLTEVLEALDDKVCTAVEGTVKVSVSEPDTCPGYLEDKIIAGDGIEITKSPATGCQILTISEKCWEYTAVTAPSSSDGSFKNGFVNVGGQNEVGAYSNNKECVVKLRGLVQKDASACITYIAFVIPATDSNGKNLRPAKTRVFPVISDNTLAGVCNFSSGWIIIDSSGNVSFKTEEAGIHKIPLDGISWEV